MLTRVFKPLVSNERQEKLIDTMHFRISLGVGKVMLLVLVLIGAFVYGSSLLGQGEPKHAAEEAELEEKAKKLKEAVDTIKKINKSQEKRKQISKEEYERIKRWLINKKLKRGEVGEVQFNKMANKGKLEDVPKVRKIEHLSVPRIKVNFATSTGGVGQNMFIRGAPPQSIRFQRSLAAIGSQLPNFGKLMSVTVSQEESTYKGNLKPVSKAVAQRQLSEFTALNEEVEVLFSYKGVCYDELNTIISIELKKACKELKELSIHFGAKIESLDDDLSKLTSSEFNKEIQGLKYYADVLIKKLNEVRRLNKELKNLLSKLLGMQDLIAGVAKGTGVFSLLSQEQRKGLFMELTNKYKSLVNKLVLNSATEKFFKFSSEYGTLPEFIHSKQTKRKQATFEEVYEKSKIMLRINKIVDFRERTNVVKGLFYLLTEAENSAFSNLPNQSVEELVVGSCKRLLGDDVAPKEDWQIIKEAISNLFTQGGKINREADFLYFTRGEAEIRQCLEDTLPIEMTKWFKGCMVEEEKEGGKKELTEVKTYNHIFLIMENLSEILNFGSKVEDKAKDKSDNIASSLCKCSARSNWGNCLSYNLVGEISIHDVLNANFKLNANQVNCLAEKIRNDNCGFTRDPYSSFKGFFQECNTDLFETVSKELVETDNCFAPLIKHQEEILQAYLNWYNGCNPLFLNLLKPKYKLFERVTNILLSISLKDGFKFYFDDEKMKDYACFIWLYTYLADLFNGLGQTMRASPNQLIKERYEELRGLCIHKVEGDKGLRKEIEGILNKDFSSGCTAAEIYSRLQIKDISKIKKILDYITAIKGRLLGNLSPPQCSLIEAEADCTVENTNYWCKSFLGKCSINCQKLKGVNECNSTQDWCSWWKGECSMSCEKIDNESDCKQLADNKCKWHLNFCVPNCEALGGDDCTPDKTSQRCYLYYGGNCWPYSIDNVIRIIGLERISDFCQGIRDEGVCKNTNGLCFWRVWTSRCGVKCFIIREESDCTPEKTRGQCSFKSGSGYCGTSD